jgi:hypothetical protein
LFVKIYDEFLCRPFASTNFTLHYFSGSRGKRQPVATAAILAFAPFVFFTLMSVDTGVVGDYWTKNGQE